MSRPWAAAVQDGITAALNKRGAPHGCGPLAWRISLAGTQPGLQPGLNAMVTADVGGRAAADRASAWACLLGLDAVAEPLCAGTVEFAGVVDAMPILVWAIVDRAAFDADTGVDTGGGR